MGPTAKSMAADNMQVHHDTFEGVGRYKAEQMTPNNQTENVLHLPRTGW